MSSLVKPHGSGVLKPRLLEGDERLGSEPTNADSLAEGERWGVAPQSIGHEAETITTPDEQTFAEKLVDEGVADAGSCCGFKMVHEQEAQVRSDKRAATEAHDGHAGRHAWAIGKPFHQS
jgi:hypothetical protein